MVITEQKFKRNEDFIFRKIIEEMVLVPIHQNVTDMDCIYTLNELGAFIWEALEGACTQAELEQAILEEFDADPQIVNQDLTSFLDELRQIGAVKVI